MHQISKNISYKESIITNQNVDNTPNPNQLKNMKFIAKNIFEPLRILLGNRPIKINSFFRSEEVNRLIGGSKTSQHKDGLAMDLTSIKYINMDNSDIFNTIYHNLNFDQLIVYIVENKIIFNIRFVHVSTKKDMKKNRNEIILATKPQFNSKYKYEKLKKDKKIIMTDTSYLITNSFK